MPIVATGQMTLTDMNDAKQSVMYIGASQSRTVVFNGVSTYAPNYASTNQVLTPQVYVAGSSTDISNTGVSCKWFYQTNGSGTPVEITTANAGSNYTLGTVMPYTLTVKANVVSSAQSMTYICEIVIPDTSTGFNVTQKAEIEVVRITNGTNGNNGANAITAILSNEADNVGADSSGSSQVISGVATTITVYEGATDVTSSWSMGTPVVTGLGALNTAYTLTGTPANRTFTLTGTNPMTADVATVTWTLTRSGYSNVVKVFTINRIRNGVAGTSPTNYRLLSSSSAIKKTEAGVYTPTNLLLEGKSQTGSGSIANYAGRFRIFTTTGAINASTNWGTAVYTSAANEASYTYPASGTFPANITGIKVEYFLAGGTTTLLDSQVIPIVSDGNKGVDAIYAYVWNPDGNAIKNGEGTIKCHVDVYNGATPVTGTAFKWYIQDPTATTASGGDADGGAGWRLLTSTYTAGVTAYTTDTITVPASAIAGTESFKCVVTYGGIKYSGVTTVVDLSDPILVRIDGANIFKNGEGSVSLRATVLQSGVEIDATGTGYTYKWSIYNSANVKTAFAKTGKSITVDGADVDGIGNLVCEIEK